jgi:integrase
MDTITPVESHLTPCRVPHFCPTCGGLALSARRPRRRGTTVTLGHRPGYDRAQVLFKKYTATSNGLELHQLRHSASTHLGDQKVPLQLIMAKARHKSPRTAMRYVKPGNKAVAEVTSLLGPPRRSH